MHSILNVLHHLVEKSNINKQLEVYNNQGNSEQVYHLEFIDAALFSSSVPVGVKSPPFMRRTKVGYHLGSGNPSTAYQNFNARLHCEVKEQIVLN